MEWGALDGFKTPYRINRSGDVQRLDNHGEWIPVKIGYKDGRPIVTVTLPDSVQTQRSLSSLMYQAFQDEKYRPHNARRIVEMIDREGEVVDTYYSVAEAAKDNALLPAYISAVCLGKIRNPFKDSDYTFRYKE